jgi:hypothetical protein
MSAKTHNARKAVLDLLDTAGETGLPWRLLEDVIMEISGCSRDAAHQQLHFVRWAGGFIQREWSLDKRRCYVHPTNSREGIDRMMARGVQPGDTRIRL